MEGLSRAPHVCRMLKPCRQAGRLACCNAGTLPSSPTMQWGFKRVGLQLNQPAPLECVCHLLLPPIHAVGLQARGPTGDDRHCWKPGAAAKVGQLQHAVQPPVDWGARLTSMQGGGVL